VAVGNLLRNGNFEEGFQPNQLGKFWKGFHNGSADFSYHIDDWPLVVPEGEHAQLIEIKYAQLPDRYLGIYQTAHVIPGEDYTFSMQGLVRTNTGDVEKTSYGYRLQVGFDLDGAQDWEKVTEWVELPWDEQLRVQDSFRFDEYSTTLTAKSPRITGITTWTTLSWSVLCLVRPPLIFLSPAGGLGPFGTMSESGPLLRCCCCCSLARSGG